VSVLNGEGKVPILFSSTSISVGALTHTAYLARPDLTGEWPTIVLVPSAWGVTGAMKYLVRRLAREGFAVICPDLYQGAAPARSVPKEHAVQMSLEPPPARVRRDLEHTVRFITNPTCFWSSAEDGFGVVGFGVGGLGAVDVATTHPGVPLAMVGVPLSPQAVQRDEEAEPVQVHAGVAASLALVIGPVLGIYGQEGGAASRDEIMEARQRAPHAEWVLHDGAGADFFDDDHPGFDLTAQVDTIERLSRFFEKHLPESR
jgi:dienelactone hydrolase